MSDLAKSHMAGVSKDGGKPDPMCSDDRVQMVPVSNLALAI